MHKPRVTYFGISEPKRRVCASFGPIEQADGRARSLSCAFFRPGGGSREIVDLKKVMLSFIFFRFFRVGKETSLNGKRHVAQLVCVPFLCVLVVLFKTCWVEVVTSLIDEK
jgi:hypothetical protein